MARCRPGHAREIPAAAALVRFPFLAGWASFVLDTVDGDLLIPTGLGNSLDPNQNHLYQNIDKAADYTTYVCLHGCRGVDVARAEVDRRPGRPPDGRSDCVLRHAGRVDAAVLPELPRATLPRPCDAPALQAGGPWDHLARHRYVYGVAIFVYKMQDEVLTHLVDFDRSDAIGRLFGR